jgi:putative transcriptional regulator
MESLRGRLLISAPSILDPNFRRTVVLVTEHADEGAMGLVLTRPSSASVAEALPQLGELVDGDSFVYVGGPVEPQAVVVLAEFDDPDDAAAIVFDDIGFVPADSDPEQAAELTRRARVFAGYSGWSPGQLEAELAQEDWIVEEPEPDDVFFESHEDLWCAILRRKGGQLALLALMPFDPSSN